MRFPAAVVAIIVVAITFSGCGSSVAGVGPPASIAAIEGTTAQTTVVGTAVAAPPGVVIKDAHAMPLAGVAVTFAITSGGGTLVGGTAVTSAQGTATTISWTLGTVAGANSVTATATGLSPVTFTATGSAGPPASATIAPADPIILAVGGTQQLSVIVADQYGNVIDRPSLSYSSNSNAVATVSPVGVIKGVSGGSTLITVVGAGAAKQITVIVGAHPTGSANTSIAGIAGRPFGIRVSNRYVVGVTQQDLNTVLLIGVSGNGVRTTSPVGMDPGDIVFDRAGTSAFVSGFNDGSVQRVNVANSQVAGAFSFGGNAYRLALSPDETRLYVSSNNNAGTLYVLDPTAMTQLSAATGSGAQGLALSANGSLLYTAAAGRVSRRTAATLAVTAFNDVGGIVQDVALSPDGTEVYVANESGWVDVLDATTLATRQRISIAGAPFGLAMAPDGTHLYATSALTGNVFVINRATRAIVRTINVGGVPRRVAFSPDGLTAFVANEGGWVDVIR